MLKLEAEINGQNKKKPSPYVKFLVIHIEVKETEHLLRFKRGYEMNSI